MNFQSAIIIIQTYFQVEKSVDAIAVNMVNLKTLSQVFPNFWVG